MELAMPFLVSTIIAPGFSDDPQKHDLTVALATIMFPYLVCMSLGAMMAGMLNSLRRYFAAAIAPVFLNVILIGVLYYAWRSGADGLTVGHWMAWGVLAAGIVQLAIVWIAVRHAGISIGFRRPRFTPNVRRLLWLAFPAAITGGITQINQLIGTAIASTQDAAVSSLALADRVYQLPLGVVGIAVGVVLLPELARALKSGHEREAGNLQNRSLEFVLFLTLPAAGALWVISDEIVRVLYERGAFSPQTTSVVAGTLAIYGLGLPGFVMIKALNPGFFAREDTKTPMRITLVSVVVNCILAVTLFPIFHERGIATAEAVSGWLTALMLFVTLARRGHWPLEKALLWHIVRLLIATFVMAVSLEYASGYLAGRLAHGSPIYEQVFALGLLVAFAMAVYFSVAFLIGGADLGMIRRNLKRRAKPEAAPAESSAE
jgi:putative peptidoglycan lipid II flippase